MSRKAKRKMNNNEFNENEAVEAEVTAEAAAEVEAVPMKKKIVKEIFEWIEVIAVSLAVVLLTFSFVARVAVVDGNSMNDTLYHKETLIVSDFFYEPRQGDIIVFQKPTGVLNKPLVKRVIATGGQTVYIDFENWLVYVYDDPTLTVEEVVATVTPLDEKAYVKYQSGVSMDKGGIEFPLTVPEGHVFCMGDNRNNSTDSRSHHVGPVDERYIMGKVILRLTPLQKLGPVE